MTSSTRSPHIQIARSLLEVSTIGEQSDPPRICECLNPPKTSFILVPGLTIVDRVSKLRHKTQNTRDEGSLIFNHILNKCEGFLCTCLLIMNT